MRENLTYGIDGGPQDKFTEAWGLPYLLDDDDFDYVRAGARLLGRDVGALASPETRKVLLEILEHETGERRHYRLAEAMRRDFGQEAFEESLALLETFKVGMEETESSPK